MSIPVHFKAHPRKKEKEAKRKNLSLLIVLISSNESNYQNEMQNEVSTTECRATDATDTEIEKRNEIGITTLSPFCDSVCPVCDTGFVAEINAARDSHTLRSLSEFLKNEYGIELSKDQLNRHFKRYGLKLRDESLRKVYEKFDADANAIAVHQKQALFLTSVIFDEIMRRLQNGTLKLGIDEYDKMVKLYHQTLADPTKGAPQNMLNIFIEAAQRGAPISQTSFAFGAQPPADA